MCVCVCVSKCLRACFGCETSPNTEQPVEAAPFYVGAALGMPMCACVSATVSMSVSDHFCVYVCDRDHDWAQNKLWRGPEKISEIAAMTVTVAATELKNVARTKKK